MINAPEVQTAEAQTYIVTARDLDFRSFHLIGQTLNEHAQALCDALDTAGIQILGPLETLYTFLDDPHGPDIPHGRFAIEVGFPVADGSLAPAPYDAVSKPAYRYISHQRDYPPFDFGWDLLRDAADAAGLTRTLQERDIHLSIGLLGDDTNHVECRLVVE